MKNVQEYLKYLLARDEWTEDEGEWMLQYLDGNDLSDLEIVAIEEFNTDAGSLKNMLDRKLSERVLKKVHQNIKATGFSPLRPVFWSRWRLASAAAIILFIAGAGYYFRNSLGSVFQTADMQYVITAINERKQIKLPDSSVVSLEPGTTLSYPSKFAGAERDVKLDGEAFFEVTKNVEQPFIVQTRFVNIEVLGTSFNVESYGTGAAKVVVATGRVKVQKSGSGKEMTEVMINPSESVIYNNITGALEKRESPGDAKFYVQRRAGKFIYNGVAVSKVIEDMQRFYHTSVLLQTEAKHCIFHGYFQPTDNIEKALKLVAVSLNATIRKDSVANSYIITGGACK